MVRKTRVGYASTIILRHLMIVFKEQDFVPLTRTQIIRKLTYGTSVNDALAFLLFTKIIEKVKLKREIVAYVLNKEWDKLGM